MRTLLEVKDLTLFRTFLKLCAGRIGQVLNLQSLANDCGISSPTAKSWLSILETSFIVFLLPPYYRNFNKRLIKSSKLYFFDTGLACYLLGMKEKEQVDTYFQKGSLFENLVIAELLKKEYHQGQIPSFYFWRDNTGNEMDLLVENFQSIDAWEMKSGATVNPDYFKGFNYLNKIEGLSIDKKRVVYGGNIPQLRNGIEVIGWYNIS